VKEVFLTEMEIH